MEKVIKTKEEIEELEKFRAELVPIAAQCLAGLLANPRFFEKYDLGRYPNTKLAENIIDEYTTETLANVSVRIASQLLEATDKIVRKYYY